MLLKVATQDSNALKITLTKFHQHLSCGSQVFKGWHDDDNKRLTTRSRLCYSPRRKLIVEDKNSKQTRSEWKNWKKSLRNYVVLSSMFSFIRFPKKKLRQEMEDEKRKEWKIRPREEISSGRGEGEWMIEKKFLSKNDSALAWVEGDRR